MITKENFKDLLILLDFKEKPMQIFSKTFANNTTLKVDFKAKKLIYPANTSANLSEPNGIIIHDDTTSNFSKPENFVVFECVHRLLQKGYKKEHIELEPRWNLGREAKGGKADILVRDNEQKPYLLIECKTTDSKNSEFMKEWRRMQTDGGQLFSYFWQEKSVKFLCLYTSDFSVDCALKYENYIITMQDNPSYLKDHNKQGYKDASSVKELFEVWKHTYSGEKSENGIFEPQIQCYDISSQKPTLKSLFHIDSSSMQKKRHEWATILRANAVGDRGLALNKLMNLLLCKITDELENKDDLAFFWKGYNADTPFELVDRLQNLYKIGMQKYLNQSITYHSIDSIDKAFSPHFSDTAVRRKIQNIFNELKYFSNGDFNFVEVYNKKQFDKNFEILLPVVQSLQNIRFTDTKDSNILGDYFETYIHDMPQQEGQYFTPVPLVNFIINSLPIFKQTQVLDFACGAGHFLTQYAEFHKGKDITFLGIDKDSRLAKIAKIASFMHGIDSHIKADDSLKFGVIEKQSCNVLISNPPYSVDEFLANLTQSDREQYELFNKNIDIEKNDKIQCFLIEKASNALKSGGVLSLVLPSTLLDKGQEIDIKTLQILLRDFYIISICAFGNQTFFKTTTQPIILYAIRKPQRQNTKMTNDDIYEDFIKHILQGKIEQLSSIYDNFLPLLERYATFRGFDKDELKALFALTLTQDSQIYISESFKEYKTAYKQILEKQKAQYNEKSTKYKENNPFVPTQSEIEFIQQKECEKFLYFCYCIDSMPIIIKSPNDIKEQKKFLGYYWSTTKGQEGIHYLNTTNIADIQTPLYNPKNQHDTNKLNYYILQNFYAHFKESKDMNLNSEIPPELQPYARKARLVDMLDFTRAEFSKAISLNPATQNTTNSANPFVDSRFEMVKIAECGDFIGGLWTGKKPPFIKVKVIRNTNFSMNGTLKLDSEYPELEVEKSKFDKRKLEYGDIIIEKSGGSNTQAVGRVVIFNLKTDELYSFSNFTTRLKVTRNDLNPFYLHLVLNFIYQQGLTFTMQSGMSGIRNLDLKQFKNIQIPKPPLEIQKQIVAECEEIEKQYQTIRMNIDEYKKLIKAILIKCGICENDNNNAGGGGLVNEILNTLLEFQNTFEALSLNFKFDLNALQKDLNALPHPPQQGWERAKLGDKSIFELKIGKRVLDSELHAQGKIPVYSANVLKPFGFINKELLENYDKESVLWGIDGDWMVGFMPKNTPFYPTDHCGVLSVKEDKGKAKIVQFALENEGAKFGFSRTLRASIERVEGLKIPLPPLKEQEKISSCIEKLETQISHLNSMLLNLETQKTHIIERHLF